MTTHPQLRPIDALLPRSARVFGDKARNLAALSRAGLPVPSAYAMSCEAAEQAFLHVLPRALLPAALFAAKLPPEAELQEARRRVLSAELPGALADSLRRVRGELLAAGAPSVAVRSSSTADDPHVASAAGLHRSVLHVTNDEALFAAVRDCWASVLSPRVFDYLHSLGADSAGSVGVVIQAMVPAEVAGVLYTVNPLTDDPNEMVLNASYGLSVLVADGQVSPDTYYIDKHTGLLRDRVIGDKTLQIALAEGGGTRRVPVAPELARREALDPHALSRLRELGQRVERHFRDARDIDWAQVGDAVYVLQARPFAMRAARGERRKPHATRGSARSASVVWSNVNVGEALPGVATPLTWSVLSGFSDLGFRRAFAALGCAVPAHANLVGNFRGRIYLNLTELSQIASQVPGLRPRAVLPLGGAAEIERLERELPPAWALGPLTRLPLTAARFARENLGLRARIERFEPIFRQECDRIRGLDLRILPSPALDETLRDVERLLDETGGLMLTAYGGLLAALVPLSATLRLAAGARANTLQWDLLSALHDVESANPGEALARIATLVHAEPGVASMIAAGDRALRVTSLTHGAARAAIEAFLERHGHRGIREAELLEPRWREDPSVLFDVLRLHLLRLARGTQASARRGSPRVRGEAALAALPLPARSAVTGLLSVARRSLRQRERLRDHVVRLLELFRLLARDVSRRIAIREPSSGEDAAFFLTLPEVHGFLRGELRTVRPLLQLRRAGYERDRALPDPPSTFVDYPPPVLRTAPSGRSLEGVAASSGQVQGVARVLRSASEISALEPGEILVVPAADVGWSPLFLVAGGLATDVGGPLSHACVVAREYGIPAVVNLRVATRTVKTGDRVLLDGDNGRLQVLQAE